MSTLLMVAWTHSGAAAMAAASDRPGDGRRVLLAGDDSPVPELSAGLCRSPGFEAIAARFDQVVDWAEEITPLHPSAWAPPREELPLFQRLLRRAWGLGTGPVELVVESVSDGLGRLFASIFHDAPITVCCPDLAAHGPTMRPLPQGVGSRVARLLHLDLMPDLPPLLLGEYGIPVEVVPMDAYRDVASEMVAAAPETFKGISEGGALILGGDITTVQGAVAQGHRSLTLVPPPLSAPRDIRLLRETAQQAGARLTVTEAPVPAAAWFVACRPELVTGSSISDLAIARRVYDLPIAASATAPLLDALPRYEAPERIPLVIADAALPGLTPDGDLTPPHVDDPAALVTAVAYAMRAESRADLRQATLAYLKTNPELVPRYFEKRRLRAFALIPPPPPKPKPATSAKKAPSRRPLHRRVLRRLKSKL